MKKFIDVCARLISDESGQDLIEYALLASLIGLAAVVILQSVAVAVVAIFNKIVTTLNTAAAGTGG